MPYEISPVIPLFFGLRAAPSRAKRGNYGRCENFYKEMDQGELVLYGRPGWKRFNTVGASPNRAMLSQGGILYFVNGSSFYKCDTNLTLELLGTLNTTQGRVSITSDGFNIVMADGSSLYVYVLATDTFSVKNDSAIPPQPEHVEFLDGFHYVKGKNLNTFHTHKIAFEPAGEWDSTDQATAEYDGDSLVIQKRDHVRMYLFGKSTIEVWEPGGVGQFPLRPNPNLYAEVGCAAAWSVIKYVNTLYWLGRSPNGGTWLFRLQQGVPSRASNHRLEQEWETYERVDDAYSQVWVIGGHPLLLITFPSENKTWVFDESIENQELQWSEFTSWFDNQKNRIPINNTAELKVQGEGSIIIGGDSRNGNLYKIGHQWLSDDGEEIRAGAASQEVLANTEIGMFHPYVFVKLENGVGNAEDSNPQARLRYSDDHGNTWSSKNWKPIGKKGEYFKRVGWSRLGRSEHRIYEIELASPVRKAVTGGFIGHPRNVDRDS